MGLNINELRKEAYRIGAELAKGDVLHDLYALCENQKTISTAKLLWHVERIHEQMKYNAHFMGKLIGELPTDSK